MIHAARQDDFQYITRVTILDSKKVFYPMNYVLCKRDINFSDDDALVVFPLPDDVKYPGSAKTTDAGTLRDYKIEIQIYSQSVGYQELLERYENKGVIVILHHGEGRIIFGCNEMPLTFLINDDNSSTGASSSGFSILLRGNSYNLKVHTSS